METTTKKLSVRADGRHKASKTLDLGFNGVSLSTDPLGTILQISAFHPKHGIVLAEPYAQFDGTRFRDTPYVREYRARMLRSIQSGRPGFGIRLHAAVDEVEVGLAGLGQARISYSTTAGYSVTTSLQVTEQGEIIQACTVTSDRDVAQQVAYTVDLGVSVNRASYGQLTEGGPLPLPKSENTIQLTADGLGFVVVNPQLGAHLQGSLETGDGERLDLTGDVQARSFTGMPVEARCRRVLDLPPHGSTRLTAAFVLRPGVTYEPAPEPRDSDAVSAELDPLWPTPETMGRFIVRRNLEYILGNCAIPLAPTHTAVCLLTDHVALPLGWMRDNYWQVRFLNNVHDHLGALADEQAAQVYSRLIKECVRGHLIWVFRYAQRPHQFWHRSYLTTGRPKDGVVFQLDQQCYPLLELCDFFDTFPAEQALVESILGDGVIAQVLSLIESKRDSSVGLYATEETPGDDVVEYPFHFSSHVLLWYALVRLAALTARFASQARLSKKLTALAADVRAATLKHFLTVEPTGDRAMFAYLVDGHGQRTFYHDANDLPTLFAAQWGFVTTTTDRERDAWHHTMQFAFSEANRGGFYGAGPLGGLGSVHTRDPWPLGFFQAWRYAQFTGDDVAESQAWAKISRAMSWDGMFSEAVHGHTGACTSKAWFSWPGSMIGSGLLESGVRERYL